MRSKSDVSALGGRGDLAQFGNTACVRDVGLNVIGCTEIKHSVVVPTGVKSFAGGDSYGGLVADSLESVQIVGGNGLLKEHGLELLKLLCDLDARGNIEASVTLNKQIYLVSNRLADGRNATERLVQLRI